MKEDVKINIDALEITYTATDEIREELESITDEIYYDEHSELKVTRVESRYYKNELRISCKDLIAENYIDYCEVAILRFGSFNPHRPNIYVTYDNRALYRWILSARQYVEKTLRLQFKQISKLDIAADFNFNIEKHLIRAYKNSDYTLIVNGEVANDKCVYGVGFLSYWNPRHRPFANPQMKVASGDNALSMKTYNKKREIEESSQKYYIQENNGFKTVCYRIEVSCTSHKKILPTLKRLNMTDEYLYEMLTDEQTKIDVFKDLLWRLIRLRKGRKVYSIIEIALNDRVTKR